MDRFPYLARPWRRKMSIWSLLVYVLTQTVVGATPSVNVAVKASFAAGPYLLELLETAAEENSTSYFPLLDRIAEGVFSELETEQKVYENFLNVLQDDGHISDPEAIASFKFAAAIHSAAPRIEAHYQYYNTSIQPNMMAAQDAACPVWVHMDDKQYCSSSLEISQQDMYMAGLDELLPFDRVLGHDRTAPVSILYADITHPFFGQFHQTLSKSAREGSTAYRVRYRRSAANDRPLFLNGFGSDLTLKRTDYIVIDDRKAGQEGNAAEKPLSEENLADEAPPDLKPLTASELETISINTASYIMADKEPLDALLRITADFPKYASVTSGKNASEDFVAEYLGNRAAFLPQGYNIIWINGLQVDARSMNAFGLLDHLKRERALINNMRTLGLSASQAVTLLSHPEIAQAQVEDEAQRYDWRDQNENGQVIMWLNNIEKDSRYQAWPSNLKALFQRSYPGQLPTVRRDIHNLVIPVDLGKISDLEMVTELLQNFIKRTVPVRFGLVPTLSSLDSMSQAKVAYHILETFGLGTLFAFLEEQAKSKNAVSTAKTSFESSIKDRKVRGDRKVLTYDDILGDEELENRLENVKGYLSRLAVDNQGPVLINGVALPRNELWLEAMSQRVSTDARQIQKAVAEEVLTEASWVPELFLSSSSLRRNALIIPENASMVVIKDMNALARSHSKMLNDIPRISVAAESDLKEWTHLLLVADFESDQGKQLLKEASEARKDMPGTELVLLHNPANFRASSGISFHLYDLLVKSAKIGPETLLDIVQGKGSTRATQAMAQRASDYWSSTQVVAKAIGLKPGVSGLLLNGRFIGPITSNSTFLKEDFIQLVDYERKKRIHHVVSAIKELGLESSIDSPLSLAKITALVAQAHISDLPEGIFETPPLIRINKFSSWNSTHSGIHTSKGSDPALQIVAAVDPTTEAVQQWIPMLKVLSELDGVDLKIFMNPRERVSEIPIKRFYRYVLDPAPVFRDDGALRRPEARFSGIPADALLNLGMDVPASWLVAPKTSQYDLDNIKLSSVPQDQNVDAVYELEHILIEGHSREPETNAPPRGVQLLLGTENDAHFADTIIMANLGYFQFKANPGFWKISLMPGRSAKIFNIDSIGSAGYSPQPNDDHNSVALYSFHGATLYPRLSRKVGMEEEDVLNSGIKPGSAMDYLSRGASFASSALSSAGVRLSTSSNADINIFSVASGHLYERMLSIMMLSVTKHTSHSVKFWFIEQFLSPSFKSSLPHLAAHYGFTYQLVTYKWPHWLRRQKEKQREIWGYKILFLDVLFPLNLDKVIFVDADQIVRTDMMDLNRVDLHDAPYGFTPMCDSREEMEGFRFWKQGYWKTYLRGKPYHISALYVVDLRRFRQLAAGDRLRQQYHQLSADPASLSNLDQDLPNHMQHMLPIHSLPMEWLWCETWCADGDLTRARTIDLCNNPLTKEPKLERARRQVPEWRGLDEEVERVLREVRERDGGGDGVGGEGGKGWAKEDL